MRKLLVILITVFLLVLCVVPVAAAEETDSDYPNAGSKFAFADYERSGFPIDYVILNDGSFAGDIVQWPFNFLNPGQVSHFDFGSSVMWGSCNSDLISANAVFADSRSISFYTNNLFFSKDRAFSLSSEHGNLRFTQVTITGRVQIPQVNSYGEYSLKDFEFEHTRDMVSGGVLSLDIAGIVRSCIESVVAESLIELPNSYSYIPLRNIIITVDFYNDDPSIDPCLLFDFPVTSTPGVDWLDLWLGSWELKAPTEVSSEISNFDFVSWLTDSIGAFFDFQIAPGLSLDNLFWVALVVSIMLFVVGRAT